MAMKLQVVPQIDETEITLKEAADNVGELQDRVANLQKKLAESATGQKLEAAAIEMADSQAKLRERLDEDLEPNQDRRIVGERYIAELSKCSSKRTLTNAEALFDMLSKEEILKIVTFKLKDLDDYLTKKQRDEVLTTGHSTSRRFKVSKRLEG